MCGEGKGAAHGRNPGPTVNSIRRGFSHNAVKAKGARKPRAKKPPAPGSCAREFADACELALGRGAAPARRVADLAQKAARRHPFVFLPDFAEDLINGVPGSKMRAKYCIASPVDFANLVRHTLKLDGFRSKKHGVDNRAKNLQKDGWRRTYELISSQSPALRAPLESLFACNVMTAAVCDALMGERRVERADLRRKVSASYARIKKQVHVPRGCRMPAVQQAKIDELIEYLSSKSYVSVSGPRVSAPEKYSRMGEVLYEILQDRRDGASYQSLMTSAVRRLPMLRFMPSTKELDSLLEKMVGAGRVIQAGTLSRNSGYSRQLFTRENYEGGAERARTEALRAGRTKFFGRSIDPERFVSELEKAAPSAQAEALAGLALACSASLEQEEGFDFAADISECRFGPELAALVSRLGIGSSRICCKAMVGRAATASAVRRAARAAPEGSQAVIFTCAPVPRGARQADARAVVVGRSDLAQLCSLVGTAPCRPGSAVRVMYGEGAGSIAEVLSADYGSGTAEVRLVPEGRASFALPCLKELLDAPDFEGASAKYLDMLRSLAHAAPESFRDGMGLKVLKTHATERDMLKSTKPYLFGPGPMSEAVGSRSRRQTYVEFDHSVCVKISVPKKSVEKLECTCGHRLDQEHYFTLCRHIVAAVNYLARHGSPLLPEQERRISQFRQAAERFREKSVANAVSAMSDVLDRRPA